MLIFLIFMTVMILGQKYFIWIFSVIFNMAKSVYKTLTVGFLSVLKYHSWHNGLVSVVAMIAVRTNAMFGSKSMGYCSPKLSSHYHCWLSNSPAKDTEAEHPTWQHSSNTPSATWSQTGYIDPLYYGRGNNSSWLESTHIPFCRVSNSTAMQGFKGVWTTNTGSCTTLCQTKETILQPWGAGVSTWPCDALVPSQPTPSKSCRLTDGTVFWRCNRGCSF